MPHFYLKELTLLFVVWIAYKQISNWLQWRALKKFAKDQGCADPPVLKNQLPWGLERFAPMIFGMHGKDFLDDIILQRRLDMGYNTYRMYGLFNTSLVTTDDPENVQAILATKFHNFEMGSARSGNFFDVIGNGIFTSDGEPWAHYRSQLKPQFSRDQVSDLYSADHHLQILFKALPSEDHSGWTEEFDITPALYRFTMDVSTEFLFGQSVNSQTTALQSHDSGNMSDARKEMDFSEAMAFSQEYIFWRFRLSNFYWLVNSKKFKQACKTVKDFSNQFVQKALDRHDQGIKSTEGKKAKYVLLDSLVEETRDPIELRDQALQLLLAGRDTTSALISWALLLLSRNPEEFTTLRTAIISHFGTEAKPKTEMTFSSLKACKPLTYLIYETLRLYPLVAINGRLCVRDTVLPTGGGSDGKQPITIKKGERVGYSAYVLHRRKDIWGEDAHVWRPARWEGRKFGWEFIAFSGGPRICLGQQYALNEAGFVIAKFLQKFDGIESDVTKPIKKKISLILVPGGGVKVKLHRAPF
ncbi:hypothetical protein B7494_g2126 [Chlorociboria aeruginascens]|nr:hypothetical protein B7494_g2126 [Chlorociboria aeruginascens]